VAAEADNRQHEETIIAVKPRFDDPQPGRTLARTNWFRPSLVGIFTVGLLVLAFAVFVMLPRWVNDQAASDSAQTPTVAVEVAVPEEPQLSEEELAALEAQAEALLSKLLPQQVDLEALSVASWGGEQWQRYEELSRDGDDAYLADAFEQAATAYRDTLELGESLLDRSQEIIAAALATAQQALEAGDAELAIEQFDIVLTVEEDNAQAQHGRVRAEKLPEVLALVRRGDELRREGQLAEAADAYRQALAIDEWNLARTALRAVTNALATARFDALMSNGFSALAAEEFADGETHFRAALEMRPSSVEASDGLTQAEQGSHLDQIALAEVRAMAFERRELWERAIEQYQAVLETDASLAFAITGLERARARGDLDAKLVNLIENPNLLLGDSVLEEVGVLVNQARALVSPGTRLEEQVARLDQLMLLASTPLTVQLQSDEVTEVTVYRIGPLGSFATKEIQVRPGTYTIVGSRNGYRDVRKTFTVLPGSELAPIDVVCAEPI